MKRCADLRRESITGVGIPQGWMKIIDISRSLGPQTSGWPGGTPFEMKWPLSCTAGAKVNVGEIHSSTHFGTHVDAPFHFQNFGRTIDLLSLSLFFGEVEVLDARNSSRLNFTCNRPVPPRIFFRTDAWLESRRFPLSIPTLTEEAVTNLKKAAVQMIGVDVPSVDSIESEDLPVHFALARAGITIVESLYMGNVEPGRYTLAAFPLKIEGGDASPVRAVLIH